MAINSVTPLPVKFEIHAYGNVYDVSNFIANWKEIEIVLKRDGVSGVFHELSFPFEFVLDAFDILKGIFDTHQYRAVADVCIYIRRDDWASSYIDYHSPQVFNLDFTSYEETDNKIAIETRKVSLYDTLKAKGKVTYDIPVSEICDWRKWKFERIELENTIVFRCVGELQDGNIISLNNRGHRTFGVSYEKTEVAIKDVVLANDITFNNGIAVNAGTLEQYYFMYINENEEGRHVEFNIDISGYMEFLNQNYQVPFSWFSLELIKKEFKLGNGYNISTNEALAKYMVERIGLNRGEVNWRQKVNTFLGSGEGCYLVFTYQVANIGYYDTIKEMRINGTVSIAYNARYEPIEIDMIKPNMLLQRLVNDMTQTTGVYHAEIEDFNQYDQHLIMMAAAESIRGIEQTADSVGAQVHTSYNVFTKWMNVFGREEHVTANSVIFKIREKSFRTDLTAIELKEDECADLKVSVDEDYLFSGVRVGYERKNIENANVRFEFNGIHDYSTDIALNDKILDLVSPYRADCYGIEFLAQERLKKTTDNKADKDLFLVHVKTYTEYINNPGGIGTINFIYKTVYSVFSGNVLTNILTGHGNNSLFNGNINPFVLMLANHGLIGASAIEVKFTASDSNAEIVIDNRPINTDWIIPLGVVHFDAIKYDIASRNIQQLPEGDAMNGLVRFRYKGKNYEGFIDEISKNPAWETETTWKLRKRK